VNQRVWDGYLTEQDRASLEPVFHRPPGSRPALLMIDFNRWAFGDRREPLLASIKRWPGSCGEAGWDALPYVREVLGAARRLGIPVVHTSQSEVIPGWRDRPPQYAATDPAMAERRRHRYDIIDEVAPLPGEVVLLKTAPSAFNQTPLLHHLRGLDADTLIVCGESTSGCVRATVVDAKSYRYQVLIPEACVFDRHEAPHAINLFDMDQKYAEVLPTEAVLAYMERAAVAGAAASAAALPG
jgi:nicotinamidase-related amidase